MTDNKPQEKDELEHRKGHSFPLVVDCDMQEEMQSEATDLCVTGTIIRKLSTLRNIQIFESCTFYLTPCFTEQKFATGQ